MDVSLWDKVKKILGSARFWIITFAWLAAYIAEVEKTGFVLSELFNQIALWLGTVAGVGTLDSIAKKFSGQEQ